MESCEFNAKKMDWAGFQPPPSLLQDVARPATLDFVAAVTISAASSSSLEVIGASVDVGSGAAAGTGPIPPGGASPVPQQRKPGSGGAQAASHGAADVSTCAGDAGDDSGALASTGDGQLAALTAYLTRVDDLLSLAAGGIDLLDQLETQHAIVSSKTGELHASCKKLTEEQVREISFAAMATLSSVVGPP
jgi:hypothetical protein